MSGGGGADSGQAANPQGGILSGFLGGLFGTSKPVDPKAPPPPLRNSFIDNVVGNAVQGLPGGGTLWGYDKAKGLSLTGKGKTLAIGAGVVLVLFMMGGGKRGRRR